MVDKSMIVLDVLGGSAFDSAFDSAFEMGVPGKAVRR